MPSAHPSVSCLWIGTQVTSIGDRERRLILDLVVGRLDEQRFLERVRLDRAAAAGWGLAALRNALTERDADAVELALTLGFRFGFSIGHLETLLALADAPWHVRHEDVVSALGDLREPRSIEALYRAAQVRWPYLDFDDAHALGVKAVYALAGIDDGQALEKLAELAAAAAPPVRAAAQELLEGICHDPRPDRARAAREARDRHKSD